jgi:hypothetical protein
MEQMLPSDAGGRGGYLVSVKDIKKLVTALYAFLSNDADGITMS